MSLLGIVRNPKSRRNRKRPPIDVARLGENVILAEPATLQELAATCRDFAARGVRTVAVDGGDGTVRDVLSAARQSFETLPAFAFVASGKTNILTPNAGSWGTGAAGLERLAAAMRNGTAGQRSSHLSTLDVCTGDRRLTGFVMGAGAFRRAVELSDRGVADRLSLGSVRVATSIGRGLMRFAKKGERDEWLGGTPMRVVTDGRASDPAARPRLIFLATTLRRFTLGVWPFWHHDDRPLRYLDIEAPPPRLAAALLPALRGRPKPWMREAGYRSGSANRILLRLAEPFILDGEPFLAGPDGCVTIEAGPAVEFLAP